MTTARRQRAKSQQGFTIIEVLVASLVMALAATATAKGMRAATNLLGDNALQGEAITLAQEVVEDLRTVRYDEIVGGSRSEGDYTVAWTVSSEDPEPGMKLITVTTSWVWKGVPRTYSIETVYSKLTPR